MVKQYKDLEDLAAQPVPVQIDDEEYLFSPLALRDYAAAKRRMRANSLLALDEYLAEREGELTVDDIQDQRAKVLLKPIEDEEMFRWFGTLPGMRWVFWCSISKKHPEITLDKVEAWMRDVAKLRPMTDTISAISGFMSREKEDEETPDPKEPKDDIPSSPSGRTPSQT